MLFSQSKNREWVERGVPNTPLGLHLGIDFEVESVNLLPDEPWRTRFDNGEIDSRQLADAARQFNNVVREVTVVLRTVKT